MRMLSQERRDCWMAESCLRYTTVLCGSMQWWRTAKCSTGRLWATPPGRWSRPRPGPASEQLTSTNLILTFTNVLRYIFFLIKYLFPVITNILCETSPSLFWQWPVLVYSVPPGRPGGCAARWFPRRKCSCTGFCRLPSARISKYKVYFSHGYLSFQQ